ncbi:MAG: HAD hydrolase-like protein [Planctomycetes bacterium]|nr:HAD hydrolase-like protein [Planctomycetota bacterium]
MSTTQVAIQAVFLDAGGTLLAERSSRASIYASVARRLGRPVDEITMHGILRRVATEMPRSLEGGFRYSEAWFAHVNARIFGRELALDDAAVVTACDVLFAHVADPRNFVTYEGARELIAALRERGLVVGVVSNWSERLEGLLSGLGLRDELDFVLVSAIERCEKPEPELFRRALTLARCAPHEALHAGNDVEKDARGATEAGLNAVLVDHPGEIEPGPFPCVRSLVELRAWIMERLP